MSDDYNHPLLRGMTLARIRRYGDWAMIIHTMIGSARAEAERWRQAASDATVDTPAAQRAIGAARRCTESVHRLEFALALRNALDIDRALVSCFDAGKAHRLDTLARRLFRVGRDVPIGSRWTHYVRTFLMRMVEDEVLGIRFSARGHTRLFRIMTDADRAEQAAHRQAVAEARAKDKALKARQAAALARLAEHGCPSAEGRGHHIVLSVDDIERLLDRR